MKGTERTLRVRLPDGCSDDVLSGLDERLSALLGTRAEVVALEEDPVDQADRAAAASVSRVEFSTDSEEEYLELRRKVINPGMEEHSGFVSSLLLRPQHRQNEYLLINLWESAESYEDYRVSPLHDGLKAEAMRVLPKPLEIFVADVVRLA